MRIRKRFLSLYAPPPSDPDAGGNHHPPLLLVQHQELHPNDNQLSDPPPNHHDHRLPPSLSDHTIQIGAQPSGAGGDQNKTKELESEEKKKEIIKTDDTGRKESILCEEANNHDLVLKGWIEGDRLIPIKKRRGSFGKRLNHDHEENSEMIEGMMKPNPNKNDEYMARKNKKNANRGNVILEGSRCSRVNGRGWRCGQQTLVGYSLCEHHLGKGRVRAMKSVRGRAQNVAPKEQETKEKQAKEEAKTTTFIDDHEIEDDDDDDDDWEVESMFSMDGTKQSGKKKKPGVVKARSLSSLLSQIDS